MKKHIHLIAVCGTGMGTLACILKEMGFTVTGSDQNVYPPMSEFLEKNGIAINQGYCRSNLDPQPDLVIIGNAISKDNPEAVAVMDQKIEYLSMPQAVNRFVAKDKKIILVTGTHGKTTTSSIMAHILNQAGLDPSFLIGGILKDFNSSFRVGNGDYMVIEGDEYDTAFFDKGPKFMHYDPFITIMTGIEFDHADIYKDTAHIQSVFSKLINKIKDSSQIIAFSGSPHLWEVLNKEKLRAQLYGEKGEWTFKDHISQDGFTHFNAEHDQFEIPVKTQLPGQHNIFNILACLAASKHIGIKGSIIQDALESFKSVKRRQEIRGVKNNITVMDDFAHHPTAVKETILAVKPFYQKGRVVTVFEPRTNTSMRKFFQNVYPDSFSDSDLTCICEPSIKKQIHEQDKFSCSQLVDDIRAQGGKAHYFKTTDDVIEFLCQNLVPNDLVLIMSNGGFENIHSRLLESL